MTANEDSLPVTHWPDGTPRDPRDIASDLEGRLIHEAGQRLVAASVLTPLQVRRRQRWISVLRRVMSNGNLSRVQRSEVKVVANEIERGLMYGRPGPDGPDWVRDAADLVVGQVYWMRRIGSKSPEAWRLSECFEDNGRRVIDRHLRRWACGDNDQFTGEFEAYGPIPKPPETTDRPA